MSSISNPAGSGTVTSTFALTSAITPTQLTADVNDYNPTSLSTASVLRLSSDASRNITGIDGGASGRMLVLHNIGAQPIVLKDESASSAAQNRFALAGDVTLSPDVAIQIQYDTTSNRWRLLGQPPGAGGVSDGDRGDVAITSAGAVYTVESATAAFQLLGDLAPATIGANQNDYDPTNLATASVLRLATDASRDITGLAGGADGRLLIVHNVAAFNIVLKDESASSAAANRFALTGDLTLIPDAVALLQYDATSSRWRALYDGASQATAAGRAILTGADAAAQRTSLGVLAAGNLIGMTVFTASGTWTKPAGCTSVYVEVRGGGGGGGGISAPGSGTWLASAGGGQGGRAIKRITTAGATETVTVGAGGAAGSTAGGAGGTGGTSSFGSHCSATGGFGGSGTTAPSSYQGGPGGASSGGDLNFKGQSGSWSSAQAASQVLQPGSGGGEGGGSGNNGSSGDAGVLGGGGGGSASSGTPAFAGGVGGGGCVTVWEFS